MSPSRIAGLALAAALVLHGRAHPQGLDNAALTTKALTGHAWDDCRARGLAGIEQPNRCMARARASASRVGIRLRDDPAARPQFWACLNGLEAGTLPGLRTASHMDRIDACVSQAR